MASVIASGHDGNVPQHTLDHDLATRWSASGDGQWIRYDLGAHVAINRVSVAWYAGEPNNLGDEDCMAINRFDPDIGWNDLACASVEPYICEEG